MSTNSLQRSRPAVFLDRDGVLNHDPGYVHRVQDLKVLVGVSSSLKKLHEAGFLLVVITNQGGIAREKFTVEDTVKFNHALAEAIGLQSGAEIDGFYVCPHHPDGTDKTLAIECECRKPGIALVMQAKTEHNIDLSKSFFIGDRKSDIECGIRAGITAIQVRGEHSYERHEMAAAWLNDLPEATQWILSRIN